MSIVKDGEHYPDAADGEDDFVRDPYWATFRAGTFDFSVIVVHVVWGDTVAEKASRGYGTGAGLPVRPRSKRG